MTGDNTPIPNVQVTNISRLVLPIGAGTVSGPDIKGCIVPNSGADWAQLIGDEGKVTTPDPFLSISSICTEKTISNDIGKLI